MKNKKSGDIIGSVSEILRPPSRMKLSEAVEQSLVVSTGGGSGGWSRKTTPYMVEPLDCVADRAYQSVIFAGSARSGKSLALIDGVCTAKVVYNPSDILLIFPTAEFTNKFSKLRISRAIRNSPKVARLLSPFKRSDNITSKMFKNGMSIQLSHPSPSALSGNDYSIVAISDHDRMSSDSNADGSVFGQAMKRIQTYGRVGCCIAESSPSRDFTRTTWYPSSPHEAPPVAGIIGLYNEGDRRIYTWCCPHCNDDILMYPDLELFNLPIMEELMLEIESEGALTTAKKYAVIYCPSCGSSIEFKHRQAMNEAGSWRKERPDVANNTASFWQSGLIARFQTWEDILLKEFQALSYYQLTGDSSKLKTTRNVDQGRPSTPIVNAKSITTQRLMSRANNKMICRQVPKGVRYLVASVDVQGNRFVVQVVGHGQYRERYIIDRYEIEKSNRLNSKGERLPMNPASYLEDWDKLYTDVMQSTYELSDGSNRYMKIRLTVCDSAGSDGVSENAYLFWSGLHTRKLHIRFRLFHGMYRNPNKPFANYTLSKLNKRSKLATKLQLKGAISLYMINTNALKDILMNNLDKKTKGRDYIHFPAWLDESFYTELLCETRSDKGWSNLNHARNESLDLLVYDSVACEMLEKESFNIKKGWTHPPKWAEDWESNPLVYYATEKDGDNWRTADDDKSVTDFKVVGRFKQK